MTKTAVEWKQAFDDAVREKEQLEEEARKRDAKVAVVISLLEAGLDCRRCESPSHKFALKILQELDA